MSEIATLVFFATAKTTVVYDRSLTEAEVALIKSIKENAIAAGEQVSANYNITDPDTGYITKTSYYSNIATANAYVTACLGFVPAPISAVAVEV